MKKMLYSLSVTLAGLFFRQLPILGALFTGTLLASLVTGYWGDVPVAKTYFAAAWKVYAIIGIINILFLNTLSYLECCVGMQSFYRHMRRQSLSGHVLSIIVSAVWPWCWYRMDSNLKSWGMNFVYAVLWALQYWLVDRWRGTEMLMVDMDTGEMVRERVKP